MGSSERFHFNEKGTRFKIFAHSRAVGFTPEVVYVDAAIDVIDARDKDSYYSDQTGKLRKRPRYPYPADGPRATRPVAPRRGHFDHLEPPAWEFSAAMTFAVVRTTLSVWGHFFKVDAIPWHFIGKAGPVLQVHPRVRCANGWSGDGFLEFGFPFFPNRQHRFCENFEVVAHETGHLIMKSMVGTMPDDEKSLQHRAHEEAAADLIALVTTLHFDSVIAHVLTQTAGFLYGDNLLSRFGEWGRGPTALPRRSFNDATMASVRALDPLTKHALSSPFTGAVYDVLVGIFVGRLVALGAIDERVAARCRHTPGVAVPDLAADFRRAYRGHAHEFAEALRMARDDLGHLLAGAWQRSTNDGLTYTKVLRHLLAADTALGSGHGALVAQAFAARGIAS